MIAAIAARPATPPEAASAAAPSSVPSPPPVTSPSPPPARACVYPRFLPVGEAALSVEFGDTVSPEVNAAVVALDAALAVAEIPGIVETVPSYRSLLVCYDPGEIGMAALVAALRPLLASRSAGVRFALARPAPTRWSVPVCYEAPHACDLPELAQRLGLSEAVVIALHGQAQYQVYTVGFAPGMPYLGGLPEALHLSRKPAPRPRVAPGAVMIGGAQACIVPTPVPSAWYQLGHTPLLPYDPARPDPFLFRTGDQVRFRRVDAAELDRLGRLAGDALLALVGHATPGLAERQPCGTGPLLFYAGLFAARPRSADRLAALLSDWSGQAVEVEQFAGTWLPVALQERTALPGRTRAAQFNRLGVDAALGVRAWDIQSRVVLRIGPLSLGEFEALLPGTPRFAALTALVRAYLDREVEFAFNLVLAADAVPRPSLRASTPSSLGWNMWLPAGAPRRRPACEAVFAPPAQDPVLGGGGNA